MMKNDKCWKFPGTAMILILLISLLAGCQLAKEEDASQGDDPWGGKDVLIGTYITTEHVTIELPGTPFDPQEEPRIYAVLKSVPHINPETGESSEHEEYVFENIKGMAFYAARMPSPDKQDFYTSSIGDEAIGNTGVHIHVSDEGETITLEGTIYFGTHPTATPVFYMNPIYQTPSGEVYLMAGTGISFNANLDGSSGAQTLDESTTLTENGETKTHSTQVKMTYQVLSVPQKVTVHEMNANHQALKTRELTPTNLPEKYVLQDQTAYLIVETLSINGEGLEVLTRDLVEPDQEYLNTKQLREDGILIEYGTKLLWKQLDPS